jgi:hypothetical protein
VVGAIIFGFSSYMIIGIAAGHNARIGAIAYMPLVIAGIHLALTGRRLLGFGITTAALALHLRVNHLQITYYLLLTVVVYGIIMLISKAKNGELKDFAMNIGLLVIGAVIAVTSFFGEIWATYEYSAYSMRGKSELTLENGDSGVDGLEKSYAFQYSNGILEPFTLFIPNVFGGSSSNYLVSDPESETYRALQRSGDQQAANQLARFSSSYWGSQSAAAPYYAGAASLLLLMLGLLFAERKIKIWLVIVFSMGIILSWGSNFSTFNYFMFDHFPGYNKFRSVTFTIVLAVLAISLLGCLGLEKLLKLGFTKETKKKLLIALGVSAGFCLFLTLLAGAFNLTGQYDSQLPVWFSTALQKDRAQILRADAFRSFLYILITFAVIWFILQKKLNSTIGGLLLVLVFVIDLWSVDARYLNKDNFKRSPSRAFFAETEADKFISQDPSISYRVYNLSSPFNDAKTSYHHKSLGGYHGAKLRRYQDLYDLALVPQTQQLIDKIRSGEEDLSELGVINMLNTKYFLAGTTKNAVLQNDYAYGNAWFVDQVDFVNNPDEEIEALSGTDLNIIAVVDQSKFSVKANNLDSLRSIKLTSYSPNQLIYESNSSTSNLAVFSEIYYPKGWKAFIDNEPIEIARANYVLRALEVPAGKHRIEFRFEPQSYFVGNKITLVGNVLVLLILLGTLGIQLRETIITPKEMEGE